MFNENFVIIFLRIMKLLKLLLLASVSTADVEVPESLYDYGSPVLTEFEKRSFGQMMKRRYNQARIQPFLF